MLPDLSRAVGVRVAPGAARGEQRRQQPRVLPADRALAGRRHDAGQRAHPVGPGDRPSSGRSCRPSRCRRRGRRRCRGGRAARSRRRPCRRGCTAGAPARPANARTRVGAPDPLLDLGGAAGVAVVEADDVEAARGEHPAEVRVPPGHRAAEPHHQQQRLAGGVAEGLVAQLDATGSPGRRAPRTPGSSAAAAVVRAMPPVNITVGSPATAGWSKCPRSRAGSRPTARRRGTHAGHVPAAGGLRRLPGSPRCSARAAWCGEAGRHVLWAAGERRDPPATPYAGRATGPRRAGRAGAGLPGRRRLAAR